MQRRGLNVRKALLGSVLPILRMFPPRIASRALSGIGRTEYALHRGVRVRVDAAIARGATHFGHAWDPAQLGPQLAGNQIRWRTRDRLLDGLSDQTVSSLFEVARRDAFDRALGLGKGVVLLSNHYGAHMMPAHWLAREGYPSRLFIERPRHISKYLARQFETDGPTGQRKLFITRRWNPKEAASAVLRAARVLNAGMVLKIAADVRWSGHHAATANFLGRSYSFSSTWVILAAMTGAPIVRVFCRMNDDGTYFLEFQDHFFVPPEAKSPDQASAWVQESLDLIESRVAQHPDNSNEYFFWSEDAVEAPVAPGEDGLEATGHPG